MLQIDLLKWLCLTKPKAPHGNAQRAIIGEVRMVKFINTTLQEADAMHERLAAAFRMAGLHDAALDEAIASAFGPAIETIERERQAKADAKARLKLVD